MYDSKQPFRYELLINEIEAKIKNGTYKIGEKLPSIREFHKQLNMSISTVYKAYVELEHMGLIEARPKSGYYVSSFSSQLKVPTYSRETSSPQKVDFSSVVKTVHQAISDPKMLSLGGLVIAPELLPVKSFLRILKDITVTRMKNLLLYAPPEGDYELRRQVTLRTVGLPGSIKPEDIIITNGCMEALALSLQAIVKPGDTVAIERPAFFVVLQLLESMGVYVVEISTDPITGMDVDELKKMVEVNDIKACITMPNFQNPIGALMPEENKKELVEFMNEKKILIIEDDIYSELYFGQKRPSSLKRYDREDLVITCSSFSKTLAPGMRIGWVIPGKKYIDQVQKLKTGLSVSTSALDQYVFSKFLGNGGYDRHLRTLRTAVKKQAVATAQAVQKYFPEKARLAVPEGGCFLWIQLPEGVDSVDLFWKAMEHHIAILPGTVCSATGLFGNYIRLSCGFPFSEEIEKAIEILGRLVEEMMGFADN